MTEVFAQHPNRPPALGTSRALASLGDLIRERASKILIEIGDDGDGPREDSWWDISEAELRVFDVDEVQYPVMVAALDAYNTLTGYGGELEGLPLIHVVRQERPDLVEAAADAAGFAVFAEATVGLDAASAYKMWLKQESWYLRHGLVHFDDLAERARERTLGVEVLKRVRRLANQLGPLGRLLLPFDDALQPNRT